MLPRSLRPLNGTKNASTPSQDKQSRPSTQAFGRAATGSSSSPLPKSRIPGLTPSEAPPSQPISLKRTSAASGGRPSNTKLNATQGSGLNQGESGPFDDHIRKVVLQNKDPKKFLPMLREDLVQYLTLQFDGRNYDHQWDGHVTQLVRVIEQLERTGECVVGGRIVRP